MIIKLKKLNKKSSIKDYVLWMNNYKITKYLDQHNKKHTKRVRISDELPTTIQNRKTRKAK